MSKVIRISEELYKRLEKHAEGFDTPSNIIEKLLNLYEGKTMEEREQRVKITEPMFRKCFELGKDTFSGKISTDEAQIIMNETLGMHPGSAKDYILNLQKMMTGELYQRTMNGKATNYFLGAIHSNYGDEKLKSALLAVKQHLQYQESTTNGKLTNIHEIYEKYNNKI